MQKLPPYRLGYAARRGFKMNINRTIIIPAVLTPLARALSAGMASGGAGMFETPLYTGAVLTHYISSGWIDEAYDAMLPLHTIEGAVVIPPTQEVKDAAASAIFDAAEGLATLAQCQALVGASVVIDCDVESTQATVARMGLTIGN